MTETLNLAPILPELTLAVGAMALLMLGVFSRPEQGERILWLALAVLVLAGIFVISLTPLSAARTPWMNASGACRLTRVAAAPYDRCLLVVGDDRLPLRAWPLRQLTIPEDDRCLTMS